MQNKRIMAYWSASLQSLFLLCICFGAVWISACSNPADNVQEASVSEAQPAAAPGSNGQGVAYAIDPTSKIRFVGSKVTGSHDGGFNTFQGTLNLVDGNPVGSTGRIEIDANSIWSDNDRLTGHLKSPDFFDVEKFPKSTFAITSIKKSEAADTYEVTGNLDLHGVTKSIAFPATIKTEGDKIAVQAEFFIKRFDFQIVYPGKANDLIRDEVVIKLDLTATKEA